MSPRLAAILTWGFIFWLFRRDVRQRPNVTNALWIPFSWLVINMSRPLSMWLQMFHIPVTSSLEGGTPVDAVFYFGLIAAGLRVLRERQVILVEVLRLNIIPTLFLAYCLISVLWSDFPFVAFKRWIKVIGHPIVALVVLTEPDPKEAVTRLLKRLSYALVPLSVLFIKYFPEWGRSFSEWTGQATNGGVTTNKNALGVHCLVFSLFYVWYLAQVRELPMGRLRQGERLLSLVLLGLVVWLFKLSDSKTPLASLSVALALMLFAGVRFIQPRFVTAYFIAAAVLVASAELTVGIYDDVLRLLGREASLTDRTEVWADVLAVSVNRIVGTGFESFWLGERLELLWSKWAWKPNQAHNGYLETYINLGGIGLLILVWLLLVTWRKAQRAIESEFQLGRFRLAFLVALIFYNWTEASFKAMHPLWTMFYVIALEYPHAKSAPAPRPWASASDVAEGACRQQARSGWQPTAAGI